MQCGKFCVIYLSERWQSDALCMECQRTQKLSKQTSNSIRIDEVCIENYKRIDSLELAFPKPLFVGDYDVNALGSKNGVGKTSVLECCALLVTVLQGNFYNRPRPSFLSRRGVKISDINDYLIKSGETTCSIRGKLTVSNEEKNVEINLKVGKWPEIRTNGDLRKFESESDFIHLMQSISGFSPNPVIENQLVFFHGYRKILEGGVDPNFLAMDYANYREIEARHPHSFSIFKTEVLRSMLSGKDLIENQEGEEIYEKSVEVLNKLLLKYAESEIGKLKFDRQEATIDIRIKKYNDSFSIDALSSGQKEVISIMFMVDLHTNSSPSVVLIDEPELHLNAEWQNSFLPDMATGFPGNQYIVATHSPHIMDVAPEEQQHILPKPRSKP